MDYVDCRFGDLRARKRRQRIRPSARRPVVIGPGTLPLPESKYVVTVGNIC